MKITFTKPNLRNINLKKIKFDLNLNLKSEFDTIKVLIRRDIIGFRNSPFLYIVSGLFLSIVFIILFGFYNFLNFTQNDLTLLFTAIGFSFIVIIPALTMGTIARERQSGIIEITFTHPISEIAFVFSKFISTSFLVLFFLILTLPFILIFATRVPIDLGQIFAQYIGAFLLGISFSSIGVFFSSLFKNEIVSLIVTVITLLLSIIAGTGLAGIFPQFIQGLLEKISLLVRYQSISRGVIDFRDIVFFFVFILIFIILSIVTLLFQRYPRENKVFKIRVFRSALISILLIIILIASEFVPFRLDMTSSKRFTLSNESSLILKNIKDTLKIDYYVSGNLPSDFQQLNRDIINILRDYSLTSSTISIKIIDPQNDTEAQNNARKAGLTEVLIAVDNKDSSQRVTGFLGLTFSYKDRSDYINFNNNNIQNLEYQISRIINKLVVENKPELAFLNSGVTQSLSSTYTELSNDLEYFYNIKSIELNAENPVVPESAKIIVIAGPIIDIGEEAKRSVTEFFRNGGSVILLTDTIGINQNDLNAELNNASLNNLFENYGVIVDENLAYDLRNNNYIGIGSSGVRIPIPYPLWVNSNLDSEASKIFNNINTVSILWGSSISLDNSKFGNNKIFPILSTSNQSNVVSLPKIDVNPNTINLINQESDSNKILAVGIENDQKARAVIVGDSDFLSDLVLSNLVNFNSGLKEQNLSFGLGIIDWASKNNGLASIKGKTVSASNVNLSSEERILLIVIGGILPIVTISIIGVVILKKRRERRVNKFSL